MTQYLPYGGLKWIEDLSNPNFYDVPEDNDIGYILEVDIEYPTELHIEHQDLPLCCESKCPPNSRQKKLLTTLENKEHYEFTTEL